MHGLKPEKANHMIKALGAEWGLACLRISEDISVEPLTTLLE